MNGTLRKIYHPRCGVFRSPAPRAGRIYKTRDIDARHACRNEHGRFTEDDRRGVQNIRLGAAHLAYTVPCNDPAAGQLYALSERPLRRCRGNAS